jgi:hypothetical protein
VPTEDFESAPRCGVSGQLPPGQPATQITNALNEESASPKRNISNAEIPQITNTDHTVKFEANSDSWNLQVKYSLKTCLLMYGKRDSAKPLQNFFAET